MHFNLGELRLCVRDIADAVVGPSAGWWVGPAQSNGECDRSGRRVGMEAEP